MKKSKIETKQKDFEELGLTKKTIYQGNISDL